MPLPNDYGFACFAEMGCGKSKISVDIASLIYYNKREPIKVLAIGPDKAVGVWEREFELHSMFDSSVRPLVKYTKAGTRTTTSVPKKLEIAKEFLQDFDKTQIPIHVVAVNYESAWRKPLAPFLIDQEWDLLILDECHRIQNPMSKSAKFIMKLSASCERRMILSGTEIGSSGVAGIFSQFNVISTDIFGQDFQVFKSRYCRVDQWGSITGTRNKDELSDKIESVAYRATKDLLDLPPLQHSYHYVDLYPEAATAYKKIAQDFSFDLEGFKDLKVNGVLAQMCRLQQICGGFIGGLVDFEDVDDVRSTRRFKKSAKQDALEELLGNIDRSSKIVVFCRYKEELRQISELADKLGMRYGEISGARTDGLTNLATMNPDIDICGAQLQAAGTGIDLTLANYGIYFSKDFSVHNYKQSMSRLHRPKQTKTTHLIHLITSPVYDGNSIDLALEASLSAKIDLADWFIKQGVNQNFDFAEYQRLIENRTD